jgi:hypothetical protein
MTEYELRQRHARRVVIVIGTIVGIAWALTMAGFISKLFR